MHQGETGHESAVCEPLRERSTASDAPSGEPAPSGRDAAGRFTAGNVASLKHGQRSEREGAELMPSLAAVLAEKESAIVADLGGAAHVSEIRRELVTRFIQSSAIADSLAVNIGAHGVLTAKGRTRAAVSLYLQVLDRQIKLASAIGLGRQTKPVRSIEDAMREAQERLGETEDAR